MAQMQMQIINNTVIVDLAYYNELLADNMRVNATLELLRTSDFLSKEDMFRSLGDIKTANKLREERLAERARFYENLKEDGGKANETE